MIAGAQRINLCFHGIGTPERELEPGERHYWISEDLYRRVLDQVMDRDDIHLSFDDGNVSDVSIGLESLIERGLTASFFALAGRLDLAGSLGTSDLRQLVASGMTIGSHGLHHVPWRGLSTDKLDEELVLAREILDEAAGTSVHEAALPLGRYDRKVLTALRASGYRHVYSSDRLPARPDSWLQPRFSLTEHDSIETVRSRILAPRPMVQTLLPRARGLIKRLR